MKNAAAGITGRLLFANSQFIQIIEGSHTAIGVLFGAIARDTRHSEVRVLLDCVVQERSYTAWNMEYTPAADMTEGAQARVTAFLVQADSDAVRNPPDKLLMLQMLSGKDGPLRVEPSRAVGRGTLHRLLDAAVGLLDRDGINAIGVEAAALQANITRQAAYRYVATKDGLLRVLVRRRQARMFQLYRASLIDARISGDAELAELVAQILRQTYMTRNPVPHAIALRLLRDYHDIAYDELWLLAAELRLAMARGGTPEHGLPSRTDLAAAIAGVSAAVKIVALNDFPALRTERMQGLIAGLFLGAIRGGARHLT